METAPTNSGMINYGVQRMVVSSDEEDYSQLKKYLIESSRVYYSTEEFNGGKIGKIIVSQSLPPNPYTTAKIMIYNGRMSLVLALSQNGETFRYFVVNVNRLQLAKHQFNGVDSEVRLTRINNKFEMICERDGENWRYGFTFDDNGYWLPEKEFVDVDISLDGSIITN